MKTIIAGSRNIVDYSIILEAIIASSFTITEVVSGRARGVDKFGEQWAREVGLPIKEFPADWKQYKNGAGPIRNCQMGDYAEALIAVWDGQSKGTKHMIDYATRKGLKVYVHLI